VIKILKLLTELVTNLSLVKNAQLFEIPWVEKMNLLANNNAAIFAVFIFLTSLLKRFGNSIAV
jgi:hypothetical protein